MAVATRESLSRLAETLLRASTSSGDLHRRGSHSHTGAPRHLPLPPLVRLMFVEDLHAAPEYILAAPGAGMLAAGLNAVAASLAPVAIQTDRREPEPHTKVAAGKATDGAPATHSERAANADMGWLCAFAVLPPAGGRVTCRPSVERYREVLGPLYRPLLMFVALTRAVDAAAAAGMGEGAP